MTIPPLSSSNRATHSTFEHSTKFSSSWSRITRASSLCKSNISGLAATVNWRQLVFCTVLKRQCCLAACFTPSRRECRLRNSSRSNQPSDSSVVVSSAPHPSSFASSCASESSDGPGSAPAVTTSATPGSPLLSGDEDVCLICEAAMVDVSLPCSHSFCRRCIAQWCV